MQSESFEAQTKYDLRFDWFKDSFSGKFMVNAQHAISLGRTDY